MAVGGLATVAAALGLAACAGPGGVRPLATLGSRSLTAATGSAAPRDSYGWRPGRVAEAKAPKASDGSPGIGVGRRTPAVERTSALPAPDWLANADAAQGWIAAMDAYDEAAYSDDWRSPDLVATRTEAALELAQASLRKMASEDEISRGTARILAVEVYSEGPDAAEVTGCIGGDEVVVYRSTGRPVTGDPGESAVPDVFHAQMVDVGGHWKLEYQTVTEAQCRAS